jgi:hypothetical protein
MRLLPSKRKPRATSARDAVSQAVAAGSEASERLASASEVRAGADALAAHEQRTIISELRAMRERNHLADLILDSVRRAAP